MINFHKATGIFFLLLFSSLGCNNQTESDGKESKIDEVQIDTLHTFAEFETHNIAQPTDVKILSNGMIAVADYSQQIISLLDNEGDLITAFGQQGRGPGEFLNIRHIYGLDYGLGAFDSHQNRLTYFDFEGELLATHDLPSHALNRDFTLINDSLYTINMEGMNGYLFQLQSLNSDFIFEFGKPNVSWEERGDLSDSYNQLISGKVPEMQKNRTKLHSDGTHLYIFFEALSEVQKYDLEGNLIWHYKIDLPNNEEIFEGTVKSAKQNGSSNSVPVLDYATDFQKIGDEIFILTRRVQAKNINQLLVSVNETGNIQTIYHFPEEHEMCFDFDIHFETNTLFLTNCLSGDVKEAVLPN
jgi:hypothetical protein